MTFYMPLKSGATGGGYTTFLRNPERNQGIFFRASRLVLNGDQVELFGNPGGSKEEESIAKGRYDRENEVIALYLPSRGSYDFRRVDADEGRISIRVACP